MKICRCEKVKQLRVEADFSADALWCNRCLYNLDINHFSLSKELKEALEAWIYTYGTWIKNDYDGTEQAIELEQAHNAVGLRLAERVKLELYGQYQVVFSPCVFAQRYSKG